MFGKNNSKDLFEELKKWRDWVLLISTLISTLVSLYNFFAGNTQLAIYICTGAFWVFLWIVRIRKKTSEISTTNDRTYRFGIKMRRLSLIGIVLIPLISVFFLLYPYFISSEKLVILIANFEGPNKEDTHKVKYNLIDKLRNIGGQFPDFQIVSLNELISLEHDSKYVQNLMKKRKASILIWGWYGETPEVQGKFYVELSPETQQLFPNQQNRAISISLMGLKKVEIRTKISDEMGILTKTIIGSTRYMLGDHRNSIDIFTSIINDSSFGTQGQEQQIINPSLIYFYRGTSYFYNKDITLAIKDLNEAINLDSKFAEAFNNRGIIYDTKGDMAKAIQDYKQSVRINDKYAEAFNNLGATYYAEAINSSKAFNNKLDTAIIYYTSAIELKKDYPAPRYNRGIAYYILKKFDSAIENYTEAIKLKRDFPEAYNARALAFQEKDDLKQTISDYNNAIRYKPEYFEAYINRGLFYSKQFEFEQAISDLKKCLEIKPDFAVGRFFLGVFQHQTRNYVAANSSYQKAIHMKIGKYEPYAALLLADCLTSLGKSENSRQYLQRSLQILKKGEWPSQLLKLYLEEIMPEEVFGFVDTIDETERLGLFCEANYYVGLWYLRRNEKEKAKELLQLCAELESTLKNYTEPLLAKTMLNYLENIEM